MFDMVLLFFVRVFVMVQFFGEYMAIQPMEISFDVPDYFDVVVSFEITFDSVEKSGYEFF